MSRSWWFWFIIAVVMLVSNLAKAVLGGYWFNWFVSGAMIVIVLSYLADLLCGSRRYERC